MSSAAVAIGACRSAAQLFVAMLALAGCGPALARPVPLAWPSTAEWRRARARLEAFRREAQGAGPRTMRVGLRMREPFRGRVMEARGAVAIEPAPLVRVGDTEPEPSQTGALRMILLGPGGTTALDLWTRGARFRFAVPALELLRKGDAATPPSEMRGLPVGFLRWWLLRPASGTLLWYQREPAAERFVLRDGPAFVDLRLAGDGSIEAVRTTWASQGGEDVVVSEERVEADSLGCASARYVTRIPFGGDARSGLPLEIVLRCEGIEASAAPNPRAFEDPDAPAVTEKMGPRGRGVP